VMVLIIINCFPGAFIGMDRECSGKVISLI